MSSDYLTGCVGCVTPCSAFFPKGRWVHSRENNGSRVFGTRHPGQAQMCQSCWQQWHGGGGGDSRAAN